MQVMFVADFVNSPLTFTVQGRFWLILVTIDAKNTAQIGLDYALPFCKQNYTQRLRKKVKFHAQNSLRTGANLREWKAEVKVAEGFYL